jgi:hypothetical protein
MYRDDAGYVVSAKCTYFARDALWRGFLERRKWFSIPSRSNAGSGALKPSSDSASQWFRCSVSSCTIALSWIRFRTPLARN